MKQFNQTSTDTALPCPYTRGGWILFCLVVLWLAAGMQAQESAFEPDSINLVVEALPTGLAVGQSFVVNVVSRIDTPAYGFGFQIEYDPAVLEVFPRPDASGNAVPFVIGTLFGQNPQQVKNADEAQGSTRHIDVVYTLLPPAPDVTGEGVLGTVAFTLVGQGETEIRLVNPRLIAVVEGTAQDVSMSPGNAVVALSVSESGVQQTNTQSSASAGAAAQDSAEEPSTQPLLIVAGAVAVILVVLVLIWVWYRRRRNV